MSNQIIPNENESSEVDRRDCACIGEENSLNAKEDKYSLGRWTHEEHQSFIEGVLEFGADWNKMTQSIRTRSLLQTKAHAQKYISHFINKSAMNKQLNGFRIAKHFSKEDMAKLRKDDIESILLLKLRFNYFSGVEEGISKKRKYFSIRKTEKKQKLKEKGAEQVRGLGEKSLNEFGTIQDTLRNNISDDIEIDSNTKKLIENNFEFSAENNFCKMEELKKMSEVLHILNRFTPESTSSQTSNNSNQVSVRQGKIEKRSQAQIKAKGNEQSRNSLPRKAIHKEEKENCKSSPKAEANEKRSMNASTVIGNLPTEKLLQLFKSQNPQLTTNIDLRNNRLEEPTNGKLRLNMNMNLNLNSVINNNSFPNGYQNQLGIQQQFQQQQQIQQQLESISQYQRLQQIQQLQQQQQQQLNQIPTNDQFYSFFSNQLNPYPSNNSNNNSNHDQFLPYYSSGNYTPPQQANQGLFFLNQPSLLDLKTQNLLSYSGLFGNSAYNNNV